MPKNRVRPTSVRTTGRFSAAQSPALARRIIATYTAAGDLVCDPAPGSGVVLAEALRAGRHACGLPTQARCAAALEANLDRARLSDSAGTVTMLDGVDDPRITELPSAVDLVLTGLRRTATSDPARELVKLYDVLNAVADWVWPGGHVVLTCRPWRHRGRLLDLSGAIHDVAEAIGLEFADHRTAPACVHPTHVDVHVFRIRTSTEPSR